MAQTYIFLHKVHDVFEVQVIVVVHDAFSDVFVQQLQRLESKVMKKKARPAVLIVQFP